MGRLACLGASSLIVIQDGRFLREMSSVPRNVPRVCQRTEGAEVLLGFLEVL